MYAIGNKRETVIMGFSLIGNNEGKKKSPKNEEGNARHVHKGCKRHIQKVFLIRM